jgi:hypothetical protein
MLEKEWENIGLYKYFFLFSSHDVMQKDEQNEDSKCLCPKSDLAIRSIPVLNALGVISDQPALYRVGN